MHWEIRIRVYIKQNQVLKLFLQAELWGWGTLWTLPHFYGSIFLHIIYSTTLWEGLYRLIPHNVQFSPKFRLSDSYLPKGASEPHSIIAFSQHFKAVMENLHLLNICPPCTYEWHRKPTWGKKVAICFLSFYLLRLQLFHSLSYTQTLVCQSPRIAQKFRLLISQPQKPSSVQHMK